MAKAARLPFTGDPAADQLVSTEPLALLIGMLLDQQIPIEWAFKGPHELKQRMGGRLDAAQIAATDPDELRALFSRTPALHRFPGSMADRVQALCQAIVEEYRGRAERIWKTAGTGEELFSRLRALPGFGDQKARIFTAVLAKRLGVTPVGWEEAAGEYAQPGHRSVADIDGPGAIALVRAHKREMKARAKAEKAEKGGPVAPAGAGRKAAR